MRLRVCACLQLDCREHISNCSNVAPSPKPCWALLLCSRMPCTGRWPGMVGRAWLGWIDVKMKNKGWVKTGPNKEQL